MTDSVRHGTKENQTVSADRKCQGLLYRSANACKCLAQASVGPHCMHDRPAPPRSGLPVSCLSQLCRPPAKRHERKPHTSPGARLAQCFQRSNDNLETIAMRQRSCSVHAHSSVLRLSIVIALRRVTQLCYLWLFPSVRKTQSLDSARSFSPDSQCRRGCCGTPGL